MAAAEWARKNRKPYLGERNFYFVLNVSLETQPGLSIYSIARQAKGRGARNTFYTAPMYCPWVLEFVCGVGVGLGWGEIAAWPNESCCCEYF